MVAGVMVILLLIKREKLLAIVIVNPRVLQLQLIFFFPFFFWPILRAPQLKDHFVCSLSSYEAKTT